MDDNGESYSDRIKRRRNEEAFFIAIVLLAFLVVGRFSFQNDNLKQAKNESKIEKYKDSLTKTDAYRKIDEYTQFFVKNNLLVESENTNKMLGRHYKVGSLSGIQKDSMGIIHSLNTIRTSTQKIADLAKEASASFREKAIRKEAIIRNVLNFNEFIEQKEMILNEDESVEIVLYNDNGTVAFKTEVLKIN